MEVVKMVNKLLVEVLNHGALFAAWVNDVSVDVFNFQKYFDVTYDNYIIKRDRVPSSRVKLPCVSSINMLEKNQEVEVYVNRTDVECSYGYGWWPATVKDIIVGFPLKYGVQLKNPNNFTSVPWNHIRLLNRNPALDTIEKIVITIPPEYKDLAKREEILEQFVNLANVPLTEYVAERNYLKVIYFSSDIKPRTMIENCEKCFIDLCNRIKCDTMNNASHTNKEHSGNYCEEFTVPQHLIKYALGHENANIEVVKSIEGIDRVYFNDNIFTLCGESEKIVKGARKLLDYIEEKIQVPQNFRKIYEDSEEIIQSIVKKSGIDHIETSSSEHEFELENVTILIVGTKESVNEAKFLINLQLNLWKKIMTNVYKVPVAPEKDELFTHNFHNVIYVHKDLYAPKMWTKVANILAAKQVSGITRIEEESESDYFVFKIFGESEDAVKKAKEILCIIMDISYHIPRDFVEKVIGECGQKIKEIGDRSGLVHIDILESAPCSVEGHVIILFIGHSEKIEKAKDMIKDIIDEPVVPELARNKC